MAATSSSEEEPKVASGSPPRPSPRSQTFQAADRVLRSADFERIYRDGKRLSGPSFAVFILPNGLERSRLGLTVTRKLGNAVVRNRSKRIVREIFRKNRQAFGRGRDFIVNIRSGALERDYAGLERELVEIASRLERGARP